MSCSSVGAEGERAHCGEWLSRTQARTLDERQVQTEYVRTMADLAVNLLTHSIKNQGNIWNGDQRSKFFIITRGFF